MLILRFKIDLDTGLPKGIVSPIEDMNLRIFIILVRVSNILKTSASKKADIRQ